MNIVDFMLLSPQRLAMPIAVYPGLHLTGATVKQMTTDSQIQFDAIVKLRHRYGSPFALTAMDLSVEAETFGAKVNFREDEVPTIEGRLVTTSEEIAALAVPKIADGRGSVQMEVVKRLAAIDSRPKYIIGGLIGPYTLAGRLYGVSESLELTLLDADAAHTLIKKATEYLIEYASAFKSAGADAVCMAEPAAGLLWPDGLREFSSRYVKEIVDAVEDDNFRIILHNCGCNIEHFPAVLESGCHIFHFGKPTDVAKALSMAPTDVVISGNLDPMEVFVSLSPEQTNRCAAELLTAVGDYSNFVLSSGCDIPPNAKLENLDAFYQAVNAYNNKQSR